MRRLLPLVFATACGFNPDVVPDAPLTPGVNDAPEQVDRAIAAFAARRRIAPSSPE